MSIDLIRIRLHVKSPHIKAAAVIHEVRSSTAAFHAADLAYPKSSERYPSSLELATTINARSRLKPLGLVATKMSSPRIAERAEIKSFVTNTSRLIRRFRILWIINHRDTHGMTERSKMALLIHWAKSLAHQQNSTPKLSENYLFPSRLILGPWRFLSARF